MHILPVIISVCVTIGCFIFMVAVIWEELGAGMAIMFAFFALALAGLGIISIIGGNKHG